jgi:hypothetical protein
VRSSPWRDGQGDVVREMVDACRAEGLGVGLYLSPWDQNAPSYGDTEAYNNFYNRQLTELLTWYGPLVEVWFDGAKGPDAQDMEYDWPRIHRTVREHQPNALIFSDSGPDIRWIGNERGIAGDPNWCMVDPELVPYPGIPGDHIVQALQHGQPHGTVWRPGEADVSIRPGWFWHPAEDDRVRTPENLIDLYFLSVGRNAGLLLNVPPTSEGLFHPADVRSLKEFGRRREALFATNLALGARAEANKTDGECPRPRDGRRPGLLLEPTPIVHLRVGGDRAGPADHLRRGVDARGDRAQPARGKLPGGGARGWHLDGALPRHDDRPPEARPVVGAGHHGARAAHDRIGAGASADQRAGAVPAGVMNCLTARPAPCGQG